MSIFSNNPSKFFQNINYLPKELYLIVNSYIPAIAKILLNKELYMKYHHLLKSSINRKELENYIRTTVRQDHDFVFNQMLRENFNKWFNIKKYLYRDCIYANYIYFLKTYCVENQSTKCKENIDILIQELGLSKNQHKKNIIRNIRWKH
jgi:ribosomal protein S24E